MKSSSTKNIYSWQKNKTSVKSCYGWFIFFTALYENVSSLDKIFSAAHKTVPTVSTYCNSDCVCQDCSAVILPSPVKELVAEL